MARTIPLRDPRTGARDEVLTVAAAEDVASEAARLRDGQAAWSAAPLAHRIEVLGRFADALAKHRDAIGAALIKDTGRRAIALNEIDGVIGTIRGWMMRAPHLNPETEEESRAWPTIRFRPHYVPYPLVGAISPWNFPLVLSAIDAIPALLAGCAVLVKPSEIAPRFAAPLRAAIASVPELAAVLAFVDGDGETGAAVVANADAVCFTGSVATGRKVAAAAAARLIPAFLELGGKDPLVVLKSAPLDRAVIAALRGSVLSTGQACQSIERIYVDRTIHDAFVDRLADAAREVRLNAQTITEGELGPLIWDKQAAIIQAQIDDAVAKGARVVTGGRVENHGGGLWLRPTVLTGVTHAMRVMTEETFGPVMPVMAFDTETQAAALANDSVYGLSGAVFAGTPEEGEAFARRMDVGAVSINDAALTALFYEAEKHSFKESGLGGSRMGAAGYTRFFRKKALIMQSGAPRAIRDYAEDRPG
jgi:succinate-semialdehyde dehydrogenase / glutarate-semialdehyde dehydrogenase